MTAKPLIWLTESDVVDLVDMSDAIDILEAGVARESFGEAKNVPKALGTWGDGSSMHSLGSMFHAAGFVGFKTWTNTKLGATAIFTLFDSVGGTLLAVIEAFALGKLRTSSISGLATRWMAPPDASVMALVGTGAQALPQIAAVDIVRPISKLLIYSPTPENRERFAEKVAETFAFPVEATETLEAAVGDAHIVTTVTRARQPFLAGSMLRSGAHYNAVGAILPGNSEFHQDVFDRAGAVVVDCLPNVQAASSEFIERFEKSGRGWGEVQLLCDVIAHRQTRPDAADITLFKAMGMGLSDLSVAVAVYQRALERGIGTEIAQPVRRMPKMPVRPR